MIKPPPRHPCSCTKTSGGACGIPADRFRESRWFCHVHDPEGNFQTQQRALDAGRTPELVPTRLEPNNPNYQNYTPNPLDPCPFKPTNPGEVAGGSSVQAAPAFAAQTRKDLPDLWASLSEEQIQAVAAILVAVPEGGRLSLITGSILAQIMLMNERTG
jgi:hypothetical protein